MNLMNEAAYAQALTDAVKAATSASDARYQLRIKQLEEACKAAESALVKQVGADYNNICHEAVLMCRKALNKGE